ncbi:hypothetical protein BT67DRAFT_442628 [Trichocladium antarcticum]|uniref:Uncharacterized protein n=1 Tax=Trichocladium antarcticum TaxID=1450529 RepID=A0AAN6UIP2_9PEZI|nr:hypothetical protein BT67DRAFT_442628 [Trichocladium antarcticum]
MLSRYDLDKYLLSTILEPKEAAACRTWMNDRLDVNDYIQATIPGYTSTKEGNPKKTFDKLVQYFKRSTVNAFAKIHYELNELIAKLQAQAISENEGPAFVTIPNKNKKNDETLVKCKDCTLMIKTSQRYYKDYSRHPSGSPASNCWICNPELAPDNYPLHQQSGVKTPSTTSKKTFVALREPNPRKILFTSGINANPSLFTT